jgi:hypothetical protein
MTRMLPAAWIALAGALLAPAAAAAQVCWWRTSLERCSALVITETAISYPLLNTRAEKRLPGLDPAEFGTLPLDGFHAELLWEVALLLRLDARTAVGPSVQLSTSLEGGEGARRLGVRGRRQVTGALAAEGSAGVIVGHAGDSGDRQYPAGDRLGPSLEASINLRDLLSVGVRYDQLPWRENGPEQRSIYPDGRAHALSALLSVGAKPSVPLNIVLLAGLVVFSAGMAGL